eukprot:TRINITY_DN27680_c0_g1_i2.p1 TRINITY_DN27680_c0_g1~~TRINITY_DN27680_c0_g1_i2.p1  ORF type:complete len:331 (-),score=20.51 TRINITY_DN27680_c0_g1_i2:213-1205(-)
MPCDAVLGGVRMVRCHEMIDSGHLPCNRLRHRLFRDGYVKIAGAIPPQDVMLARRALVELLVSEGAACPHSLENLTMGIELDDLCKPVSLLGRAQVAEIPAVRAVLEHPALYALIAGLFGTDAVTMRHKWLRAVPQGQYTGVHSDSVYFPPLPCEPAGHQEIELFPGGVCTIWIPLGHVPVSQGALMVCRGSHKHLARDSGLLPDYGYAGSALTKQSNGTSTGWLTRDAGMVAGGHQPGVLSSDSHCRWDTCDFQPGDVVVLRMDTIHMTACNVDQTLRLSCDTRWMSQSPEQQGWLSVATGLRTISCAESQHELHASTTGAPDPLSDFG